MASCYPVNNIIVLMLVFIALFHQSTKQLINQVSR